MALMDFSFTEQEMLESKQVMLNFDFNITKEIAQKIGNSRIIFTGMGSSLIFPGKQAKNRALKFNLKNKIETFFASYLFEYTYFSDSYIFLCSDSGKTKEVILLLEYVQSKGAKCIAVTAVSDSILAQRADEKIFLSCGFEKGVAATKSVIEQGLVYDSLIFHLAKIQGKDVNFDQLKSELNLAAEAVEKNINAKVDEQLLQVLVDVQHYFMVGLETGVAEEITLKSYEISRKMALFFPDTHIVHGPEEAIEEGCAIIFDPASLQDYISDFEKFAEKTHTKLIGIGADNLIAGLKVELNETFKNYCLLSGGWGLLRNVGNKLGIDIDHPIKASKVGNPFN